MTDTRAAAERVRPMLQRTMLFMDAITKEDVKAFMVLADAYLELVPADDGEAITQEWLLSIGFSHGSYSMRFFIADELSVWYSKDGRIELVDTPLPHVKTRGDVRRLLAALGVGT